MFISYVSSLVAILFAPHHEQVSTSGERPTAAQQQHGESPQEPLFLRQSAEKHIGGRVHVDGPDARSNVGVACTNRAWTEAEAR
jgi:hypothetical protein